MAVGVVCTGNGKQLWCAAKSDVMDPVNRSRRARLIAR